MTAALAWIVVGVFLSGLCLGGLIGALFGAIVAKLPSAHIEVHEPRPEPESRTGRHIRWERERREAKESLVRDLDAASARLVGAGLLDDTRIDSQRRPR